MRDGKRSRAKPKLVRDAEGYVARLRGREVRLFDPERCLKVGRHWGELGVVFTVWKEGGTFDRNGEWHQTLRGLVRWEGGPDELAVAAMQLAMRLAGVSRPDRSALEEMVGSWGARKMWEDLASRHGLGEDIEAVKEVMEA